MARDSMIAAASIAMLKRSAFRLFVILLATGAMAFGDSKSPNAKAADAQDLKPMTKETRMLVIRSLNAETVYVRKALPMGKEGVTLEGGVVQPDEQKLRMLIAQYGMAAKPGDRAQITSVDFKGDTIRFEINGGPVKKKKWYQHIQIGGAGGMVPVAPDTGETMAKGTYVDLKFDKFIPDLTGDQIREMLAPIFDFHAKSAAEAYLDTVPPKVKEAVKDHKVLVGMNREMVMYAKGRPHQKIREKDAEGKEYEEWIYGVPPQEVDFVRFEGDQVVRLEQMKVDGTKVVRTEKEVEINDLGSVELAAKKAQQREIEKQNRQAPTLRRPGEKPEFEVPGTAPARMPPPPTTGPTTGPPSVPPGS